MAEIFGSVAGALSVAALFNNCVDCFEYVQLGRHFGRDYERCQLKVDVARTRLSRWGEAVAINEDPRFVTPSPADESTQLVLSILEEIALLFQSVQKISKRYELGKSQEGLVLFRDGDMQPVFQRLHNHLTSVVHRRQKHTGLLKKTAWALYEGKYFDNLVEEITSFVDKLEKICPVGTAHRRLVQLEIKELKDEPSLEAVSEAATGIDNVMAEAAVQKAEGIATKNRVGKIGTQEKARVRIGNEVAVGRGVGISDQTTNTADTVDATGESTVHVGNSYGGRSIFD